VAPPSLASRQQPMRSANDSSVDECIIAIHGILTVALDTGRELVAS
jgi:hypothetical protein